MGGNRPSRDSIARGDRQKRDHKRIAELIISLPRMAHNTGKVTTSPHSMTPLAARDSKSLAFSETEKVSKSVQHDLA